MGVRLVVRSLWPQAREAEAEPEGAVYEFDQARVMLGRGDGADVQLPHLAVSSAHASLRVAGAGYTLVDEGSTNGSRVNGLALVPGRAKTLRSGDRIELGGFAILVETGVPVASPTSALGTAGMARLLVRAVLDGEEALPPPSLRVVEGPDVGVSCDLGSAGARGHVGRADECILKLTDADCSRRHAEVFRDHAGVIIRDLESKNGLIVNGRPCGERRLRDRDEVHIGGTTLVFEDPAEVVLAALRDKDDLVIEAPSFVPPLAAAAEEDAPSPEASEDAPAIAADPPEAPPGTLGRPASPRRSSAAPRPATDMIIYMLAGAVIALSLVSLWLLFGEG